MVSPVVAVVQCVFGWEAGAASFVSVAALAYGIVSHVVAVIQCVFGGEVGTVAPVSMTTVVAAGGDTSRAAALRQDGEAEGLVRRLLPPSLVAFVFRHTTETHIVSHCL